MSHAKLNRQLEAGRKRAFAFEDDLTEIYARRFRALAREASARFRAISRPGVLVAAGPGDSGGTPDWAPPDPDELMNGPFFDAQAEAAARKIHLEALRAALPATKLEGAAVSLDVVSPFAQPLLEQVGTKGVNLGLAARDVIVKVIGDSYDQGLSVQDTAMELRNQIDHLSMTTARMQARTDLNGLANGASLASVQTLEDAAPAFKQWLATPDERTRPTHMAAEGQTVPLDQPFTVGLEPLMYPGDPSGSDGETINCFPAETLVGMPSLRAVTRRRYEGDLVRVRFASGDVLAGTPNHPVLRADGCWTALVHLHKGDNLVRAGERRQSVAAPDPDDAVASIGEIYRLGEVLGVAERVGGAPPHFHGDGSVDEEVDVVAVDGSLLVDSQAASDEEVSQFGLAVAHRARASGCGREHRALSAASRDRCGDRLRASSGVGGTGQGGAAVLVERAHADPVCVASAAHGEPELAETMQDDRAADPESLAHGEHALLTEVSLAEIVDVERYPFHGFVYNLDTRDGWYLANATISANCRCTIIYTDVAEETPLRPDLAAPVDVFENVHRMDVRSTNPVYTADFDGNPVIVKPEVQIKQKHLATHVEPGRDLERELAAKVVADGMAALDPALPLQSPNYRILDVPSLGRSGVTDLVEDAEPLVPRTQIPEATIRAGAIYDTVIGNLDRHAGNILSSPKGISLIDHGVSFPTVNEEWWPTSYFTAEPIIGDLTLRASERALLEQLRVELQTGATATSLRGILTDAEITATQGRIDWMLREGRLPERDDWRAGL